MKISVIGTGYVGLVAGVCFADAGHTVHCIDNNEVKIKSLLEDKIPIYEPGLQDVLVRSKRRIEFSTDIQSAVEGANVIFSAVGTPEGPDGKPNMTYTDTVAQSVVDYANSHKYFVLKSTVPIGTAKRLQEFFDKNSQHKIEVVSNPEFLREGVAVDDFLYPDRVVIGCKSPEAKMHMHEIYEPFIKNQGQIIFMDNASAEMCKYAANAFLATKISFVNELALLADEVGADINEVRRGFTSDNRINPAFFNPGLGYGGSCFPKDVKALVKKGEEHDLPMKVIRAVEEANDNQKIILHKRLQNHFGNLSGKTIAIWGLSFKPNTDDIREAPALSLISKLVSEGVKVKAYDPVAGPNAKNASSTDFELCQDAYSCAEDADALVIVTEWNEFKKPDFELLKSKLKSPLVFDGRNIYHQDRIEELGFEYYNLGRQILGQSN